MNKSKELKDKERKWERERRSTEEKKKDDRHRVRFWRITHLVFEDSEFLNESHRGLSSGVYKL